MKTIAHGCLMILLAASTAFAASVHLKGGKNAKPTFVDNGVTLSAFGELSGLGNGDVLITMDAEADVTSTCTNNGGNAAPGQNPAPITVSGSQAIPDEQVKNGSTPFSVITLPPQTIIPGAPDCPNSTWVEEISDLAFTSAVITVEQPAGNVVMVATCSFDPATEDGNVPKQTVSCQQL